MSAQTIATIASCRNVIVVLKLCICKMLTLTRIVGSQANASKKNWERLKIMTTTTKRNGKLRKVTIRQAETVLQLLFPSVHIVVAPNGQSELWVKDDQGYGFRVKFGSGKAGVSATIGKFTGNAPVTVTGNADKTMAVLDQVDAFEVTATAYRNDERAQAFKAWYGGRGEYPEDIAMGFPTATRNVGPVTPGA